MEEDRRQAARIDVGFYATQVVDDEPHRCFTTNLSASGLYMERFLSPMERRRHVVQIEIPLPGVGETLWAKAEVVYDCFDALFHGTAIRFTAMAQKHRRQLREWLHANALTAGEVVHTGHVSIFRPPSIRSVA